MTERPPRLYRDKKGRYIKIGKKKLYIRSELDDKKIKDVVIKRFTKKPKKEKVMKYEKELRKEKEPKGKILYPAKKKIYRFKRGEEISGMAIRDGELTQAEKDKISQLDPSSSLGKALVLYQQMEKDKKDKERKEKEQKEIDKLKEEAQKAREAALKAEAVAKTLKDTMPYMWKPTGMDVGMYSPIPERKERKEKKSERINAVDRLKAMLEDPEDVAELETDPRTSRLIQGLRKDAEERARQAEEKQKKTSEEKAVLDKKLQDRYIKEFKVKLFNINKKDKIKELASEFKIPTRTSIQIPATGKKNKGKMVNKNVARSGDDIKKDVLDKFEKNKEAMIELGSIEDNQTFFDTLLKYDPTKAPKTPANQAPQQPEPSPDASDIILDIFSAKKAKQRVQPEDDPTGEEKEQERLQQEQEKQQQEQERIQGIIQQRDALVSQVAGMDEEDPSKDDLINQIDELDSQLPEDMRKTNGKGMNQEKGLYDYQIEKMMKPFVKHGFKGVYSIDEIDDIPINEGDKKVSFIMNLQPSDKGKGTHWVAVNIDGDSLEYYDSFADEPPKRFTKDIQNLIEKMDLENYLKFKVNKIKRQSVSSSNCGYFAMKFIMDRIKGIPFPESSGFSQVGEGEADIEKFKKKFKPFEYI